MRIHRHPTIAVLNYNQVPHTLDFIPSICNNTIFRRHNRRSTIGTDINTIIKQTI